MEKLLDLLLLVCFFYEFVELPVREIVLMKALLTNYFLVIDPFGKHGCWLFEHSLGKATSPEHSRWDVLLPEVDYALIRLYCLVRLAGLNHKYLATAPTEYWGYVNLAVIFHVSDDIAVHEKWLLVCQLLLEKSAPVFENLWLSLLDP